MDILITGETLIFNGEVVRQSGLIRGKYHTWKDFRNGLVSRVQPDALTILFQTGANSSTSYYRIKAAEVAAGLWELIYTNDFDVVIRTGELCTGNLSL